MTDANKKVTDQAVFRPDEVVARVRARLIALGGATELAVLERLAGYELDVLIRRECGWGSTDQWTTFGPAVDAGESTDGSTDLPPTKSQGLPSGCPQTNRGTMAA